VAATSGITAVIGTDRVIEQQLGEGQTGWLVTEAALHGDRTLASRIGHLVELLLCAVALGAVVVAIVRSRRSRPDTIA
jgi:apolipoprotein N-acyltransferase